MGDISSTFWQKQHFAGGTSGKYCVHPTLKNQAPPLRGHVMRTLNVHLAAAWDLSSCLHAGAVISTNERWKLKEASDCAWKLGWWCHGYNLIHHTNIPDLFSDQIFTALERLDIVTKHCDTRHLINTSSLLFLSGWINVWFYQEKGNVSKRPVEWFSGGIQRLYTTFT